MLLDGGNQVAGLQVFTSRSHRSRGPEAGMSGRSNSSHLRCSVTVVPAEDFIWMGTVVKGYKILVRD